jgi:hypothetical protein
VLSRIANELGKIIDVATMSEGHGRGLEIRILSSGGSWEVPTTILSVNAVKKYVADVVYKQPLHISEK